jgi:endonuclease/exonuclease/phosphatase (EEP) superfamily protein YafD
MRKIYWGPIGYAILILIWFGLWLAVKDGWWWMASLNRFAPQLFLPAPFILLLAVMSGQRKLVLAALVPIFIFSWLYWPYFIPRPAQSLSGPTLRMMTFNVLYTNTHYDAIADLILEHQPDLAALQEVQPGMMRRLEERLSGMYPFSLMGSDHPYGTTAAFSRHPLTDSYVLDTKADRPAVVMRLTVNGEPVTFVSAHLLAFGLNWVLLTDAAQIPTAIDLRVFEQERQALIILEEVQNHQGTVIVACDCNSKETSGSTRILAGALTNAAWAVGQRVGGTGLAGGQPDLDLHHIDFVFFRGPLTAEGVYTLRDTAGSDHLPVVAEFAINLTQEK